MLLSWIYCTFGIQVMDDSLSALIDYMGANAPKISVLALGKSLAAIGAMCLFSYECYMMILGRRGMDVMKLLQIVAISFCIQFSPQIGAMVKAPGRSLTGAMQGGLKATAQEVVKQEQEVVKAQQKYIDAVHEKFKKAQEAKAAEEAARQEDMDMIDKVNSFIDSSATKVYSWVTESLMMAESMIGVMANNFIRFLGEAAFQIAYYSIIVGEYAVINLMTQFLPFAFGISLFGPFRSAWSQFIAKMFSVSLWPAVASYLCIYAFRIMSYTLQADLKAYQVLINNPQGGTGDITALGTQMLGTAMMYVVGLLVGVKMLSMAPEVCSWLIPGGVSSPLGSMASGAATQAGAIAYATGNKATTFVGNIAADHFKRQGGFSAMSRK